LPGTVAAIAATSSARSCRDDLFGSTLRIVPETNLLDLLSADHENLLEAVSAPQVAEVSQHLSVERDFLYPAISHHVADGKAIVEELRQAERQMEERLRDLENDASPEHRERVQDGIRDHVTRQGELFTRLRELIPESALLIPLESIALSIGGAPTHAHPHLAEGGALGALVEDVTSAADHALDRLRSKRD
jgi:hypothetical protein